MNNFDLKNQLRKKAKETRKSLSMNSISKQIQDSLLACDEYKNATNIFCYHSFADEVRTVDLFADTTKNWFLPRMNSGKIDVCEYLPDKLLENQYGILEPDTKAITSLDCIDLIILPALMGDKYGNRLGYGKGFYDKFLCGLEFSGNRPFTIVLLPEELLIDELPAEVHDIKCCMIITQCNVRRF